MEKSRAIELLKLAVPIKALTQQEYSDFIEAINMAIDALELPTIHVETDTNVGDTISRQAALDAIDTWDKFGCDESGRLVRLDGESESLFVPYIHYEDVVNAIKNLPTIQPEPSIPLSWIEKYIEWLKSFDNEFANLAAAHISVMVKKWRDEKK